MSVPSLQKTTLLSFTLHLTVFLIAFLILRQTSHIVPPAPYTVSLVSPDVLTGIESRKDVNAGQESKEAVQPAAPSDIPKKSKKEAAKEKEMIDKKLSELEGKKKNIDKLARLHSISVKVKADGDKRNLNPKIAASSAVRGVPSDNYYSKIMEAIQPYWALPPGMTDKVREAIVAIKILKDGTVIIHKLEQSSGNKIIDRAALSALAKASPLPAPPYEMEIGVRFYP